jgi:hypothetical protein
MNPSRKKTKNSFEKFFTVLWHTLVVYDIWIFIIIFSYSHLISHITIFNKHTVPPFSTLNSIRPTHLIKKEKLRAESSAWSGSFYDIFLIFFHSFTQSLYIYMMWWDEEDREGVFVDVNVRWRGCERCRICVERWKALLCFATKRKL